MAYSINWLMKPGLQGARPGQGQIGQNDRPRRNTLKNKALRKQKKITFFAANNPGVIKTGQDYPRASPILTHFVINVSTKRNRKYKK